MEFSSVVRGRHMIRDYDPARTVPIAIRDRLLRDALTAPSAGNTQGREFLVLEAPADRARFWAATTDADRPPDRWLTGMRRAPLLILCFSDPDAYRLRYAASDKAGPEAERRWPVPYWHIDTGFAALLMLLAAVDEGLGACFFGVPRDRVAAVRAAFAAPSRFVPVGVIAVGYPAAGQRSRPLAPGRRPAADVIHHGIW